jgi:ATP-dependent Clp protease ATP-binding subunit ClpC
LQDDELLEIVSLQVELMNRMLRRRGLEVRLTEEAKSWIVKKTCADRTYGARPLRRALQKYVEDPLSEALIQGELGDMSLIEVYEDGGILNHRPAGVEEIGDAILTH